MIAAAARTVDRAPTEAQKRAGNYAKGHVKVLGFDIAIENPKGGVRAGVGSDGKPWSVKMPAHYGYIKRTEGADGDHVDVYVGPHTKSQRVFVVDQVDPDGRSFDEHKIMLGFANYAQARRTYIAAFSDGKGEDRIGAATEIGVDQLRRWLKDGDTTEPMASKYAIPRYATGGRVEYAEGGAAGDDWTDVDDWAPVDAPAQSSGSALVDKLRAAAPAVKPVADAFRSVVEHPVAAPITGIPGEIYKAGADALTGINDNLNPFSEAAREGFEKRVKGTAGWSDPGTFLGTGKGLLSLAALPFSPITGAARSLIGRPLSWIMPTATPQEQERLRKAGASESMIPGQNAEENFERARHDVDTAMSAMAPRGISPVGARAAAVPPRPTITPREELAQAAERLGVEVPVAGATDNLIAQRAGAAVKEIPLVGDPLVKASRRSIEGLGRAAEDVAAEFGSGNVLTAGDAAKTAIADWITGKSRDVTKRLYDRVDNMVDQTATRPLHETQSAVSDLLARRIASGENSLGKAVDLVADAITRPGGLTYAGTKDLRTRIGSYLDGSIVPEAGTSMPELKKLYEALSKDLRGNVLDHGGPDALTAFDRANKVASLVAGRREALAKIIGKDAGMSSEGVLDRLAQMASTKSSANIDRLTQARKAIGGQGWNEVASAVISRIGRDPAGNFSPDRFVTAYGKMSDEGKRALFGSTGRADLVQALDDIAMVSERAQQIARYGNPSGTGRVTTLAAMVTGLFTAPLTTLTTVIGGHAAARALARPVTARAIANWTKAAQRAQLQATPPAQSTYAYASANLARSLAQLGLDPAQVMKGLQGVAPGYAGEKQE